MEEFAIVEETIIRENFNEKKENFQKTFENKNKEFGKDFEEN